MDAGTIINKYDTIVEQRSKLMSDFFTQVPFEFRLTIGDKWENYVAKSAPEPLLNFFQNIYFSRNTEANKFKNIML